MKCALKYCGATFTEPSPELACPTCKCFYFFDDAGILQGPEITTSNCFICGVMYNARASDIYVLYKTGSELHACPGRRQCGGPGCTRDADKLATVHAGGYIVDKPGGQAYCTACAESLTVMDMGLDLTYLRMSWDDITISFDDLSIFADS